MLRRHLLLAAPALLLARATRADESIRLRDLYERRMSFSPLALALQGERVTVAGFMARPPSRPKRPSSS